MSRRNNLSLLLSIWKRVIGLLRSHPVILVPFLCVVLIEVALLFFLFLAPRPPLSVVMAPVIRAFWGERFLHYPVNFLLLPKLFSYGRTLLSIVIGVVFSGMAVSLIMQAQLEGTPRWWPGLQKALKKYLRLMFVWAITLAAVVVAIKALSYIVYLLPSRRLILGIDYLVSMIVQVLLLFSIPAIIVENRKTGAAIVRSLALFRRYPAVSFIAVLVPSLLFAPVMYIHARLPKLFESVAPEMVLYALILRIVVLTVIDFIIISFATLLLLTHREQEKREGIA